MMPPPDFVFKNFLKKTVKNVFYLKNDEIEPRNHPKLVWRRTVSFDWVRSIRVKFCVAELLD